jgi:hypothetical protein
MHQIQPPAQAIGTGKLKALLRDLTNIETQTSIRLEINGKTLPEHFSTVLVFEEHALLLTHLPTRTVLNVPDLDEVTGFMIDKPCQSFLPFRRYLVRDASVTKKIHG